jgi:hypothetical protein
MTPSDSIPTSQGLSTSYSRGRTYCSSCPERMRVDAKPSSTPWASAHCKLQTWPVIALSTAVEDTPALTVLARSKATRVKARLRRTPSGSLAFPAQYDPHKNNRGNFWLFEIRRFQIGRHLNHPKEEPVPDYQQALSNLSNPELLSALDLALLELETGLFRYARVGPELLEMVDEGLCWLPGPKRGSVNPSLLPSTPRNTCR